MVRISTGKAALQGQLNWNGPIANTSENEEILFLFMDAPFQVKADFWGGDATKHFSVRKKGIFSEKGGGNSVNQGFGKDFYRKGNSVKRSGRFREPPDSEKRKVAVLIPFPKFSSYMFVESLD